MDNISVFQKAYLLTKEEQIFECTDNGYSWFLIKELRNALEKIFLNTENNKISKIMEEEETLFDLLDSVLLDEALFLTKLEKQVFCQECYPYIKNLKQCLKEN